MKKATGHDLRGRPDFQTVQKLLAYCEHHYGDRPMLGTRVTGDDGKTRWDWTTYGHFSRRAHCLSRALISLGLEPGDRVAIMAGNRREWAEIYFAVALSRAAIVPIYETISPENQRFLVEDSGAKIIFAARRKTAEDFLKNRPAGVTAVFALEEPEAYERLIAIGEKQFMVERIAQPDDLLAIIYTSGKTGEPKGVRLTQRNLAQNATAAGRRFPLGPGDTSLAFLPWTHSFGLSADLDTFMSLGMAIAVFSGELSKIGEWAMEVHPTVICTIPDLIAKIRIKTERGVNEKPKLIRDIYRIALSATAKRLREERLNWRERLALKLADRLIFRRVRRNLGGQLRFLIVGADKTPEQDRIFAEAIGLPVCGGYGLTENSPIVSADGPEKRRAGSVGRPLPGTEVKIMPIDDADIPDGQGEIWVRGPSVMDGYHHRPEETAKSLLKSLTGDDWLKTGDIGRIDPDGYLYVFGRKNERMYKTGGKKVFPERIADRLRESPLIAAAYVTKSGQINVALIVPADGAVSDRETIRREISRLTADLETHEKIRRFELIEPFTEANGQLTPTKKMRPQRIESDYADLIARLGGNDA